jgi:hypothetical protein
MECNQIVGLSLVVAGWILMATWVGRCGFEYVRGQPSSFALEDWSLRLSGNSVVCDAKYRTCNWVSKKCPLQVGETLKEVYVSAQMNQPLVATYLPACGGCWQDTAPLGVWLCLCVTLLGSICMCIV